MDIPITTAPVPIPFDGHIPGALAETSRELPAEQLAASSATLADIFAQRNGRLRLEVVAPKRLIIGRDVFNFSVTSSMDGYLYAVMLGSDGKSFYLLYPNKLDRDNRIKANLRYTFPKAGWSISAAGPAGTNQVLFVVAPSPVNKQLFSAVDNSAGGPFSFSVADLTARKRLVDFFVGSGRQGHDRRIAAAMVRVDEVP